MATAVLVAVAAVAAWYAAKVYRVESKRDRERYELAEREQASKVSAWVGARDLPAPRTGGIPQVDAPGVYVLNRSELSVYDVRLDVFYVNAGGWTPQDSLGVSIVPPFTTESTWVSMPLSAAMAQALAHKDGELRVGVRFRDAQGREWSRSYDGRRSKVGSATLAGAGTLTAVGTVIESSGDR